MHVDWVLRSKVICGCTVITPLFSLYKPMHYFFLSHAVDCITFRVDEDKRTTVAKEQTKHSYVALKQNE